MCTGSGGCEPFSASEVGHTRKSSRTNEGRQNFFKISFISFIFLLHGLHYLLTILYINLLIILRQFAWQFQVFCLTQSKKKQTQMPQIALKDQ